MCMGTIVLVCTSIPDLTVELEWVHGYRSDDSRNNLRYNADGEIVYIAAGVGITYNQDAHTQRCALPLLC